MSNFVRQCQALKYSHEIYVVYRVGKHVGSILLLSLGNRMLPWSRRGLIDPLNSI